ncbi:MAG TPA: hypothetical protein VHV83_04555 [Armatimonadota bacterium]|nr:hypothetical protein [Armatimonadota bacterium]
MAIPQPQWSRGNEFFRDIPVTKIIIAIWILGFLVNFVNIPFNALVAFIPGRLPNAISGLITYPLAMDTGFIGLLLNGLMLYWFGGSLERAWGWRNYLVFLIGSSIVAAIFWQAGIWLFAHRFLSMATPWLLISSCVVAWAWLNPEQTVLFWFVLPLKAKWIGWITLALLFFTFPPNVGPFRFILGLFALGGPAFALLYVWYQRKWAWIPRRRQPQPSSRVIRHPASGPFGALLRPYREWQRRRRVAKLQKTFKLDD